MIQFGHNDASPLDDMARARGTLKGTGEEIREIDNPIMHRHETVHTFGWYLRKYVADIKARGAAPVICSRIPGLGWKEGHIVRNKADYAGWAEEVAKAAGVPFLDINESIARKYDQIGPDKVAPLFPADHTHTDLLGAQINAACVVKGLRELKDNPLAPFLSGKASEPNQCEVQP